MDEKIYFVVIKNIKTNYARIIKSYKRIGFARRYISILKQRRRNSHYEMWIKEITVTVN